MRQLSLETGDGNQRDSLSALLSLGVLAYVGETMLHEAVGHGGMCLATGGRITALAPLWMRCSVAAPIIVFCGPAINFLAGGLLAAVLRYAPPSGPAARAFLWLSFAFNTLVASGYLVVGGASGFGDWGVLFANVQPALLWRLPAILIGAASYYFALVSAARLYQRLNGVAGFSRQRLWNRTVVPAIGAAVVACAAEIVGGRLQLGALSLALGCTLVVGLSLTRMGSFKRPARPADAVSIPIAPAPGIVALAAIATLVFIFLIGPGFNL